MFAYTLIAIRRLSIHHSDPQSSFESNNYPNYLPKQITLRAYNKYTTGYSYFLTIDLFVYNLEYLLCSSESVGLFAGEKSRDRLGVSVSSPQY